MKDLQIVTVLTMAFVLLNLLGAVVLHAITPFGSLHSVLGWFSASYAFYFWSFGKQGQESHD